MTTSNQQTPTQTSDLEHLKSRMVDLIGEDELIQKMQNGKTIQAYWGTSPIIPPTFSFFLPLLKLKELLSMRAHVMILLADVHSFLDRGSSIDKTRERTTLHKLVLTSMLQTIGVNPDDITFVVGSDHQFDRRFCMDLLQFSSFVNTTEVMDAVSGVLRKPPLIPLSHMLYPLMQCLDETFLDADLELGCENHRRIFEFSRTHIHKLGYEPCSYLIYPELKHPHTSLGFLDSDEIIRAKIFNMRCFPRDASKLCNPLLALTDYILFPRFGQIGDYKSITDLTTDFLSGVLKPNTLRNLVFKCVVQMIQPVRECILNNMDVYLNAYDLSDPVR